jgi:hypothetical protein
MDSDGYGDPACENCIYAQQDCDDGDSSVNPGATEGPVDDPTCSDALDNDCDGLFDDDPECVAYATLEMAASYRAGRLSFDFLLATPEPAVWGTLLVLINPTFRIIPLWTTQIPEIYPAISIPVSFPFPKLGLICLCTGILTQEGLQAYDYQWIYTGSP